MQSKIDKKSYARLAIIFFEEVNGNFMQKKFKRFPLYRYIYVCDSHTYMEGIMQIRLINMQNKKVEGC